MSRLLRRDGRLLDPECDNNALRIQQAIGISNNSEEERSFLTLSRAKNHLRATSQYWLDHLAVMIIESNLLSSLGVTTLIDEFAHENENQQRKF